MCGRFASTLPHQAMRELFQLIGDLADLPANADIAPTDEVLAIRWNPATRQRSADALRWGLIPHWAANADGAARMINCRAETIDTAPAFREAFAKRRCLIPADAFYEWGSRPKRPYTVRPATGRCFAFAGLWENWRRPDGSWLRSCTIVTTAANEPISRFHHRMPVILAAADHARWLGEEPATPAQLLSLLRPGPAASLTVAEGGPPRQPGDQIGLFD